MAFLPSSTVPLRWRILEKVLRKPGPVRLKKYYSYFLKCDTFPSPRDNVCAALI